MKRVLQFAYGLESGGIEAFVTNLNSCKDVFEEPFDFLLYCSTNHVEFYEKKNIALGSHIYKLGDDCSKNFVIACIQKRVRAYQFMKKNRYDVVHIHNSNVFCILEAMAAKMAGVSKVVVHSHNTTLGGKGIKKFIKYIFQVSGRPLWPLFADEYCACSTEAGIWMFGKQAVEKGKVAVLKNGIIAENYYFNEKIRNKYRNKLGWDDNYIIGHVGRFSTQKNHVFLIDIFKEIYHREPKARLVLFGVGELQEKIKEKVHKLGLDKVVCFYGTSSEINNWLQAMDLYLFPSLYEGLPVSGIEAQASGVQILASNTISSELEITDCINWMKLEQSSEQWAEKALELMKQRNSRDTQKKIQKAGYDIKVTAEELKTIYEK